jgi:hypothetical protein
MSRRRRSLRRSQAGFFFFIVYGSKNVLSRDGQTLVAQCPTCRQTSHLVGMAITRYATLYGMTLFATGQPVRYIECSTCGAKYPYNFEELRAIIQHGADRIGEVRAAARVLQQMQQSPQDSAKLLQMMRAYRAVGEAAGIISVAQAFPQALEASDACLGILAQAHAHVGDNASAQRCAAAALALNPQNAEAIAVQNTMPK